MADAGTVTVTEKLFAGMKKLTYTWLSSAGGAADLSSVHAWDGDIICAYQVPDGGGTQPTNLYDVTLLDGDGIDVLGGLGANLANTGPTVKRSADGLLPVSASALYLHVTNAGNAKGGKLIVYVR